MIKIFEGIDHMIKAHLDQKDARIAELLEANNRYVEQNRKLKMGLSRARNKFDFYAEEHARKSNIASERGDRKDSASSFAKMNANLDEVIAINELLRECRPV
jgi:hypothetical protein